MLLQSLPTANKISVRGLAPVYHDHFLFSENVQQPYYYPEHTCGFGLLISRKGNCNYYVNGIKNSVEGQRYLCINKNSKLAIKAAKDTTPVLLYFRTGLAEKIYDSLYVKAEYLLESYTNPDPDFSYLERIHNKPYVHQSITSLIALGKSCSSFAALKADIMIRNLFENLVAENKQGLVLSQNLKTVKTSTRIEIYRRVSLVKEWLDENFAQNVSLEDMAGIANMNSQHFLRMFKQIYQVTPYQYLIDLRFQMAKELLQNNDRSVKEACISIGYESVHSFSIQFKKNFGINPSQILGQDFD